MAGLVPAIHVFFLNSPARTWMPGTRPGMMRERIRYCSPTLNGGSLPGGVDSSAIANIIATMT
jgi:hypothetical protein